jgi:hypothetical protein
MPGDPGTRPTYHRGQFHVVPANVPMRVLATGRAVRRALALILHPEGHAAIHIGTDPPTLVQCQ